mgnify:CR=1 FL=1
MPSDQWSLREPVDPVRVGSSVRGTQTSNGSFRDGGSILRSIARDGALTWLIESLPG